MQYTEEVLDRSTGELVTRPIGDWITVTELGELYGVSRIRVRAVLRQMDFLYVAGGQAHQRHRLTPWVVQAGHGKFIPAKKGGPRYPFDVISPTGQQWISERWAGAVAVLDAQASKPLLSEARGALDAFQQRPGRTPLNAQGQVLWLRHHFRDLTDTDIANVIGVTQQLVSRYTSLQRRQLEARRLALTVPLQDTVKVQLREEHDEGRWPPAEQGRLPTSTTPAETYPAAQLAA